MTDQSELKKLMLQDFSYPLQDDPHMQDIMYKKKEFNSYKIPDRPKMKKYEDIEDYRYNICGRNFTLSEHQQMLANFINPDTPYKGLLIMHGLGTGKTATAINIAEKFKDQVMKYGTKIYVLVSGPNLKENWKNEIIKSTGNTYLKYVDENIYLSEQEKTTNKKDAVIKAMQFYRLISYRGFYKKVLGEKIVDFTVEKNNKKHVTYRKTEEGEFERETSTDRIFNLNNTLLIVDEAHNLTGNMYGDAVKEIIKNSTNLKILLLSATPMKNLAHDLIYLVNLLRPINDQIDRDMIFTSDKNYDMAIKSDGIKYLRKMIRGYISFLRGGDPLIFAKRVDYGIIPKSLKFTKVIPCYMSPFQKKLYDKVVKNIDDALDRSSEAVSNFVFPCLNDNKTELEGCFGKDGINTLRNQVKSYDKLLNTKLSQLLKIQNNNSELVTLDRDNKTILGKFLDISYIKHFSTKFYTALKNINKLVYGKRNPRTAFIYSNLVKVGIDLFKAVLIQNGYIEYSDKLQIQENTKCYFCGRPYSEHNKKISIKTKKHGTIDVPEHTYRPATFIVVTGKSNEDEDELLPEEAQQNINNVFNNLNNLDGKYIKFILGSKVISEGVSMNNVSEVHILDVYFNFGRVDQVVGRAIRRCSHYNIMSKDNPYPEVHVYKYAIMLETGEPSTEELLYQKAEQKHLLIKKVERVMKEEAIDCALNGAGNVFHEDLEMYKNCGKEGQPLCPAMCDYMNCDYKCSDPKLNKEFYDAQTDSYRNVKQTEIDKTTFSHKFAIDEINFCKRKIKELYLFNYVYTLESILNHIKSFYSENKKDMFDKYYVYKALDELIPISENDFNNYTDVFVDKYGREGYIIYVDNFYIFQPFDQPKDVPMYYRKTYDKYITNNISLYEFLKYSEKITKYNANEFVEETEEHGYDFDSVYEYYSDRPEYDIVGIIDKESNRKKNKSFDELSDVFKIREKRVASDKRRATGVQTLTGSVCHNSKTKQYLKNVLKKFKIDKKYHSRDDMCIDIRNILLDLEKYGTTKNKNKFTYVIIPANHKIYPFPYNLEDRVQYIINKINAKIKEKLKITVSDNLKGKNPFYTISINDNDVLKDYTDFLKSLDAKKEKNNWIITVS